MTSPVIVEAIRTLVERRDLTRLEAAAAMEALMSGAATSVQVAAFLTALRMKGETVDELIGLAEVMRLKAVRVRTRTDVGTALAGTDREMLIDTAGTGGDASGTFNVSTATAFVVAGAGLKVAKHGNRSVSSLCGSADVVEALGVSLALTPTKVAQAPRQSRPARLCFWIVLGEAHQHAKPPHALALLPVHRERPRRHRAAEPSDEFAPSNHSITSSAASRRPSGTSIPRALAVLRLMMNLNFVGRCTGRSPGLVRLRMRST